MRICKTSARTLFFSKCYINSLPGFISSFAAPVSAVLTVEPSGTRLPAELPSVSRCAGTRAVCLVALPVDALAVSFTALAPQSFPALAASRELVARRVVAVALNAAVPPGPPGVAHTSARHGVAHGVDAAVTVVVALGAPDARVTCAFARLLVALALLTEASILAVGSPTIVVAGTLSSQVVTLAVWVTVTFPFAVGPPKLGRALCSKANHHHQGIINLAIGRIIMAQMFSKKKKCLKSYLSLIIAKLG